MVNIISYLLEPEEGGETLDAESLSKFFLSSGVNLGEGKRWVLLGKNLSSSGILRGKLFAVSTIETEVSNDTLRSAIFERACRSIKECKPKL